MHLFFKKVLIFTVLLISISCKKTSPLSQAERSRVIDEVNSMLTSYHQDILKDGLQAEFKYLDSSKDFFWIPPGYHSALSYDSVKNILINNDRMFKQFDFSFDQVDIKPLTNYIANYSGIVNSHTIDSAGVDANLKILESGTLIKRNGAWKFLNGQSRLLSMPKQNGSPLRASFAALIVSDFEASLNWYNQILGFKILNQNEIRSRSIKQANLQRGAFYLELISIENSISANKILKKQPDKSLVHGFFKLGFSVGNLELWAEQLEDLGVEIQGKIVYDKNRNKKMFIIKDPEGNRIQFFEE